MATFADETKTQLANFKQTVSIFINDILGVDVGLTVKDKLNLHMASIKYMCDKQNTEDVILCEIPSGSSTESFHRSVCKESDIDRMFFPIHLDVAYIGGTANKSIEDIAMMSLDDTHTTEDIAVYHQDFKTARTFKAIDADQPGYVKLYKEQTLITHNDVSKLVPEIPDVFNGKTEKHGPALTQYLQLEMGSNFSSQQELDNVYCLKLKDWPSIANEWIERPSNNSYLTKTDKNAIITQHRDDEYTGFGCCHLVSVAHTNSSSPMADWRISFSVIEQTLARFYRSVEQSVVYTLVRLYVKAHKQQFPMIKSYYIKTLMLWLCDEMPLEWWSENTVIDCFYKVITTLIKHMSEGVLKHYFIPENNILSGYDFKGNDFNTLLLWNVSDSANDIKNSILEKVFANSYELMIVCGKDLVNRWRSLDLSGTLAELKMFMSTWKVKSYIKKKEEAITYEFASHVLDNLIPYNMTNCQIRYDPVRIMAFYKGAVLSLQQLNMQDFVPLVTIGIAKEKMTLDGIDLPENSTPKQIFDLYLCHDNEITRIVATNFSMLYDYIHSKDYQRVIDTFANARGFLLRYLLLYPIGPRQVLKYSVNLAEKVNFFDDILVSVSEEEYTFKLCHYLHPLIMIFYCTAQCYFLQGDQAKACSCVHLLEIIRDATNNRYLKLDLRNVIKKLVTKFGCIELPSINEKTASMAQPQIFITEEKEVLTTYSTKFSAALQSLFTDDEKVQADEELKRYIVELGK